MCRCARIRDAEEDALEAGHKPRMWLVTHLTEKLMREAFYFLVPVSPSVYFDVVENRNIFPGLPISEQYLLDPADSKDKEVCIILRQTIS